VEALEKNRSFYGRKWWDILRNIIMKINEGHLGVVSHKKCLSNSPETQNDGDWWISIGMAWAQKVEHFFQPSSLWCLDEVNGFVLESTDQWIRDMSYGQYSWLITINRG
jgi:hypothetical protein